MNLSDELANNHSKSSCDRIVSWVGDSQERFDELFNLFLTGDYRTNQRASWPVSYCVAEHPSLIKHHFKKLLDNVERPGIHDAVKRNTVRLLQHIDIPKKFQGRVLDLCFRYVEAPKEAVAIKAFSLTVLGNLSKQYPEIIPEIKLLIESQVDRQSAAFRSRAKKLF